MDGYLTGQECPEELREFCREDGFDVCRGCTTCKLTKYKVCIHCPGRVRIQFHDKFESIKIAIEISKNL